jgi:nitric oxide reductase NorE protein
VTTTPLRRLDDPPGGVLPWLIVALELLTFAIVFVLVALQRRAEPAAFAAGQASLDPAFGLGLTLTLVTSGALAAQGVHRFRHGARAETPRWFLAAAALGAGFIVMKGIALRAHLLAGHRLGVSDFWDAYLLSTGFHRLHVVVGVALLVFVARRLSRAGFGDEETAVAGVALFWHLCDAVWFFLFPLFFARA